MSNKPTHQHEALSQEERELARVVRALPGGEPPAALDALILKSATDAVAASHPQKKTRWGKGVLGTSALWLGTAAASILTVGIGWQVFQSMRAPIYELPDSENVRSAQEIDRNVADESLTVDMTQAREPLPTSPPALEESGQTAADASTMASAPAVAAAKPKDIAPAMAENQQMARAVQFAEAKKTEDARQRDQAAEAFQDAPMASGIAAPAAAPPPPAAPAPPMAAAAPEVSAQARQEKELDAVSVTGSRVKRTDDVGHAKAVPRLGYTFVTVTEDSKLLPEAWLEAIRTRVERNDIEGAKASLKLFKKKHPDLAIPEELKPLLQ